MSRNYRAAIPLLLIFAVILINSCEQGSTGRQPEYMVFGIFCGECTGHCATMYRYNLKDNPHTLLVDSTDSYFTNNGNIQFKTPVTDPGKILLADSIAQNIPKSFLITPLLKATFGCPDCLDGCGIYLELGEGGTRKKFYIDYQTGRLPENVKAFAELLKKKISELESNR